MHLRSWCSRRTTNTSMMMMMMMYSCSYSFELAAIVGWSNNRDVTADVGQQPLGRMSFRAVLMTPREVWRRCVVFRSATVWRRHIRHEIKRRRMPRQRVTVRVMSRDEATGRRPPGPSPIRIVLRTDVSRIKHPPLSTTQRFYKPELVTTANRTTHTLQLPLF